MEIELDRLWVNYFHIKKYMKITPKSRYRFGRSITTNGVSVSILRQKVDDKGNIPKKGQRDKKTNKEQSEDKKDKKKKKAKKAEKITPNIKTLTEGKVDCYAVSTKGVIVGVDPGKHSVIYMTTDSDKKTKDGRFQYT